MKRIYTATVTIAWTSTEQDEKSICQSISEDMRGTISRDFGVWVRKKGGAISSTFQSRIVDPKSQYSATTREIQAHYRNVQTGARDQLKSNREIIRSKSKEKE